MANKEKDPEYVYVTFIKTTPEKLWDALTNPEFTRQYWFGIAVESDWKVGSSVQYRSGNDVKVQGKVLASDRPKFLSYTFHEEFGDAVGEPPSKVTLEIEPGQVAGTVKLTVTHTDFVVGSKLRRNISKGWPAVLSGVKTLLETGGVVEFRSQVK